MFIVKILPCLKQEPKEQTDDFFLNKFKPHRKKAQQVQKLGQVDITKVF